MAIPPRAWQVSRPPFAVLDSEGRPPILSREMADENKSESKAGAKPKAAKTGAAQPAADGPKCKAPKCKQAVRAKGYCRKHFIAWRRGEVGNKHRYKVCSKEGCRKPRAHGGLCEEHSGKGKAAEGAAA